MAEMNATSAHTPGPWTMVGREIFGNAFDGSARLICDKVRGGSPVGADANARLIAAAPDLLYALRDVLAQFDAGYFVRNTESDGCSDWAVKAAKPMMALAAAQAAIAKAEGR